MQKKRPLREKASWDLFEKESQEEIIAWMDKNEIADPDLNAQDWMLWTPLHYACHRNHSKVVEKLVFKGANPNIKDHYNRTPFLMACPHGHYNTLKLLLEKGADPAAKDRNGHSSFYNMLYSHLVPETLLPVLTTLLIKYGATIQPEVIGPFLFLKSYTDTINKLKEMQWIREDCSDETLLHPDYLPRDLYCVICKIVVEEFNETIKQ